MRTAIVRTAIATFAAALIGCAASALAQPTPFAVDTPALTLDGNHVDLSFNITGLPPAASPVRDVKIMFCSTGTSIVSFSEDSIIAPALLWWAGNTTGNTTIKAMVQAGWTIQSIFNINTSQFFIVFVK